MNQLKLILTILIAVGLFGAGYFISQVDQSATPNPIEIIDTEIPSDNVQDDEEQNENNTQNNAQNGEYYGNDRIQIFSPLPGETVSTPIKVRGRAKSNWFFEATMPITVTDWNGLIIKDTFVMTEDNWMQDAMLNFETEIAIDEISPVSNRASIIFRKNNPSGLSELDDYLEYFIFLE